MGQLWGTKGLYGAAMGLCGVLWVTMELCGVLWDSHGAAMGLYGSRYGALWGAMGQPLTMVQFVGFDDLDGVIGDAGALDLGGGTEIPQNEQKRHTQIPGTDPKTQPYLQTAPNPPT